MLIQMMAKQKLIPVEVPWSIDGATPYLRLTALEASSDLPTNVEFFALFPADPNSLPHGIHGSAEIIYPHDKTDVNPESANGTYQRLRVAFVRDVWVRMNPSHSDDEILDADLFDFSAIRYPDIPTTKADEWLNAFHEEWLRTGICPDPHMYEVHNSHWLREVLGESNKFKHYLLMGHDVYVEIIAEGWEWSYIKFHS